MIVDCVLIFNMLNYSCEMYVCVAGNVLLVHHIFALKSHDFTIVVIYFGQFILDLNMFINLHGEQIGTLKKIYHIIINSLHITACLSCTAYGLCQVPDKAFQNLLSGLSRLRVDLRAANCPPRYVSNFW